MHGFRRGISLVASLFLLFPCFALSQPTTLSARRARLRDALDAEWQYELRTHPELATQVGDPRYNDRFTDYSAAAVQADMEHARRQVQVFEAIDTTGFPEQEKLNKILMIRQLRDYAESERFKDWEMPVDQMNGIQIEIPYVMSEMPLKTPADFNNYIKRLHLIPLVLAQTTANMRQGMADHLMPPKFLLEKAATESEDIADKPLTASPFASPLKNIPAKIQAADRVRLTLEIQSAIHNEVDPAYAKFATFVNDEYAPQGRTEDGVWALPDGDARYRYAVRTMTTTNLTPEQIHAMGVKQVAEIEAQMLKVAQSLGYRDLASFNDHIRHDPSHYGQSGQQIFDLYKHYTDQMYGKLPQLFGHLPRTPLEVVPMDSYREAGAPPADYSPGSDNRPGKINVNEYDPTHRLLLNVEAIAYHEGIPGHHMQFSIAQELPDIPAFRRYGSYTAYSEGWAFYAERLGKEVGFYQDPYSEYGRLENEMWRSVRLVVDTGVHSQHWTRQQMVDYFHQHTAMDDTNIAMEVDRYIAWPGQALAYKLGQMKILELRERAQRELGAKFEIRKFHDAVLAEGPLPLDILDQQITAWIAEQKRGE